MLEPTADNPKVLLEHHRRQAQLNREAGDLRAAEWHGRMAQRAFRDVQRREHEATLERARALPQLVV